jgi:hypothetical protein
MGVGIDVEIGPILNWMTLRRGSFQPTRQDPGLAGRRGSLNELGPSPKARLVVTMTEVRS